MAKTQRHPLWVAKTQRHPLWVAKTQRHALRVAPSARDTGGTDKLVLRAFTSGLPSSADLADRFDLREFVRVLIGCRHTPTNSSAATLCASDTASPDPPIIAHRQFVGAPRQSPARAKVGSQGRPQGLTGKPPKVLCTLRCRAFAKWVVCDRRRG